MYVVRLYGYDAEAGPDALLEEGDFISGLDAMRYIAECAQDSKRVTLGWRPQAG